MSTGKEEDAVRLVTDKELIVQAKALKLVQNPLGQGWMIAMDNPEVERQGPVKITSGPAEKGGDNLCSTRRAVLDFRYQKVNNKQKGMVGAKPATAGSPSIPLRACFTWRSVWTANPVYSVSREDGIVICINSRGINFWYNYFITR